MTIRLLILLAVLTARSSLGDEWKLYRHEGRDYVSLDNIAAFYAFPPPQPIPQMAAPASPSAPVHARSIPSEEPSADGANPTFLLSPAAFTLTNGKNTLTLTPNGREAQINGVNQWLAFATVVEDGRLLVSRLDLAKVIEPRLRPEKAQGLGPVTTVVLDPGHGGHDNGAYSHFGLEKDFALDVVTRARQALERKHYNVILTRSADLFVPLPERPNVANHLADSIFVSVHFNSASSNPDARGFEIYSCAPRGAPATNDGGFSPRDLREEPGNVMDTQNTILAGAIYHSLLGHIPVPDRGIKHARFAVLRLCTQPAVLIEGGFVSNSPESALIASPAWRQQLADAIVTGIGNYKELAEQHLAPKLVADYRSAAEAGK